MRALLSEVSTTFNEDQQAAIGTGAGIWQVLAGPGSGKTAVLVERYNRLVYEGVHPVCLTFTKKAANEMKERASGGNFRTIHSMAYKILRDAARSDNFIAPPLDELVPSAFQRLSYFGHTHKKPYTYLMVDEAQDCSLQDWEFISLLSSNIFAVGDFQQCVFGFRGSKPDLFLNMPDMFPSAKTLLLGTNYRSTKSIVEFCKKVAPVRGALLEKFCTENEQGPPVKFERYQNNIEEAEEVIVQAVGLHRHDRDERTVVLARTNRQLREFEKLKAPEYIELSTIHAAKGKEWDHVFIVGVQDGLIPFRDGDVDEEARILFVACSRARKHLTLTGYGTPTRFLREVL